MNADKRKEVARIKKMWNGRADIFDKWSKTFQGTVGDYVDWELLKKYLPKNKNGQCEFNWV